MELNPVMVLTLGIRLASLAREAVASGRKIDKEEVKREVTLAFTEADAAEEEWESGSLPEKPQRPIYDSTITDNPWIGEDDNAGE